MHDCSPTPECGPVKAMNLLVSSSFTSQLASAQAATQVAVVDDYTEYRFARFKHVSRSHKAALRLSSF